MEDKDWELFLMSMGVTVGVLVTMLIVAWWFSYLT